ncbi:hypothetical protein [Segniliparus rugosus]|uniref:Uncharacterized protein n=1 Tax=Segniliparus rugosus (strain ATCC BAA-974 / DSM 45345 / CCUG 50838 / CIP 108380 / JCM 13579 / CDC 945) TaxID=679197 RepID=E5XKL1_SEGRC|nr:hypothetical protein [Segniliparus rugosus]EFV15123.1 hypothetical protein HMPREF9336_00030 [Segniliparus rugosus ATCC BAA-974]
MTTQPFATANQYVLTHDPSSAARKRRRWIGLGLGAIAVVVALLAWALWPQTHAVPPPRQLPPPPLPPLAERSWHDLRVVLPEEDAFPGDLRPVKKSWEPYPLVPTAEDEFTGKVVSDNITYSTPECAYYPLDAMNVQTLVSEEKYNTETQGSQFVSVPSDLGIAVKLLKWSNADRGAELESWIDKCGRFDLVEHWDSGGISISLTDGVVVERQQDPALAQAQGVGIKMSSPSIVWHVSGVPIPDQVYTMSDEYTYIAFVRGIIVVADCKQFPGKQNYLPIMQKMFLETYQKVQALP